MYDDNAGKAVDGSEIGDAFLKSGLFEGESPPKQSEVIEGWRTRNSARGAALGDRSAIDEKVVRRGKVHPLREIGRAHV